VKYTSEQYLSAIGANLHRVYYRSGYEYHVTRDCARFLPWYTGPRVKLPFLEIRPAAFGIPAVLIIKAGYAWDGPSGPTWATASFMRGSLFHDGLYQLIREGLIAPEYRRDADDLLKEVCLEDGMWSVRAWWVHRAVVRAAAFAALGSNAEPERIAP
jgi:hypothetical protein